MSTRTTRNREWVDQIGIEIDGNPLALNIHGKLIEVVVDTALNLPSTFHIRLLDTGMEVLNRGPFELGAKVKIKFGAGGGEMRRVITGEITTIEPEFTEERTVVLVVSGYDLSHRLTRGPKSQVLVNISDSDIAQSIGQEASLQVEADATPQTYDHVFQDNLTNLAFLQQRAQRNGFEVFVDDTTLYFRAPHGQHGETTIAWGDNLRSFYPRLSLVGQVDEVLVKGWNPDTKEAVVGQATSSQTAPRINAGDNGGSMAQEAFSSSASQIVVRRPVSTQPEADSLAQAILDGINAGYVEAEGWAKGNPLIVAGNKITINEVGQRFSGDYLVTSATHVYTQDGYETQFRVEGARARLMSDLLTEDRNPDSTVMLWSGVVPAIVTNVEDPDGMARVKLKFPWMDSNLESDWARIIGVGAGNERGLFWLPEVNDEVLVAFEQGDFNRPFVLGNLWNGQDAPPESIGNAVKGGAVEVRTLKTREGHTIRLVDDSSNSMIEIVDAQGNNTIKLDTKNNELEIITKGKLKIKSDGETSIEAGGNLKIKGSANVNVEASGQLTLKGAVINLN